MWLWNVTLSALGNNFYLEEARGKVCKVSEYLARGRKARMIKILVVPLREVVLIPVFINDVGVVIIIIRDKA